MDKLSDIIALWPMLLIFLSVFFMRMAITIVHEAGHAVTIAIFTKSKVKVYLGSYGDEQKSVKIPLGIFEVWFKKNILKWKGGLCVPQARSATYWQQFIYILAGPLASLLLSLLLLAALLFYHPGGYYSAFLLVFCIAAGLSFLSNISPGLAGVVTNDGDLTHNDGAQLRKLMDFRKSPAEYNEAAAYMDKKQYGAALDVLVKMINNGTKNADVYRMAVTAQIGLKNYEEADRVQKMQIAKIGNIDAHDRINLGLLKTFLGKYNEAESYYTHLLKTGGDNKYNLNNFGFTLTLMGRYEEAITYLNKAILKDKAFAFAYSNRAFAKMKTGQLEEGKKDNDISMQLDDTNANAHRNAGIYYLETGQYQLALQQLERARELDANTFLLDKLIIEASNKLIDEQAG